MRNKYIIYSCLCLMLYSPSALAQDIADENRTQKTEYNSGPEDVFDNYKNHSTGAVATVSGDILYKTPTSNLTNTLYGLLPGLSVRQGNGEAGNDAATLNIRGIGAYTYGNCAVYIDGFQSTMSYAQYLSPVEIESFTILKDAATLAVFGMKGANGVIWITTKRGNIGKPQIDVKLRTGIHQLMNITEPLGSYDYATLYNEAVSNDNGRIWTPSYSGKQLENYLNGRGIDVDWYDKTLKSTSPFYSADVSFKGGNENARYFVFGNFVQSNGFYNVSNDDFRSNVQLNQFNLRSNFDFTAFDFIDGKIELGGRIEDRSAPAYKADADNSVIAYSTDDLWNNLATYPSNIYPIQNPDGTWAGTTVYPDNPVASIREKGKYSRHDRSMQANFELKERLDFVLPGFYLAQSVSFSNWTRGSTENIRNYARMLNSVVQTNDRDTNYELLDDKGTNQWNWLQFNLTAGYFKKIGRHSISAGLRYSQSKKRVDARLNGEAKTNMDYANVNYAGRINYTYNDRYIVGLSASYSGSDNYKPGNRYVLYPAVSAAWEISKEGFMRDMGIINYLKIRASAGKTGYDTFNGRRYMYQQYYTNSGSYPTGSTPTWNAATLPAYIANEDITAEQSMKYNIGIDATMFKGLSLIFDAFVDKRSQIVSKDNSLMATVGQDNYYHNLGKTTTKGLELSLEYRGQTGDFRYDLAAIGTFIKNKIDYMAELPTPSPYAALTGNPIGTHIGYEAIGFYDISDFDANGNIVNLPAPSFGAIQPGDIKYCDINDDNIIDERDMKVIGNAPFPKLTYSFILGAEYKSFDLRMVWQGAEGRDVNLYGNAQNKVIAFANNTNAYPLAKERWAYYPDQGIDTRQTAKYPRLSAISNSNNYRSSSFWIKDGSFIRLRNIEIGYSIPKNILAKLHIEDARVYISGVNLLTFSKLLDEYDIDPEFMTGHPGVRSYNIGLSINF